MSPMKHAGSLALDQLEPLLAAIRALPGLKEKGRGVFYRGGKAFLHFHEDPAGLFADVRLAGAALIDMVDQAEGLGLVGAHEIVAVQGALDDLDRLAGVLGIELVQLRLVLMMSSA
jgi:hypothetical protein